MLHSNAKTEDPLFQTSDPSLLEMWDEIQTLQADFAVNQELPSYYRSPHWQKAQTVLDLGTGNGHYLSLIAQAFMDKRYTGIDKSADLIEIARQRVRASNIEFLIRDAFTDLPAHTATGKGESWDFVIARLFFQHIPTKDLTPILNILSRLTNPGGCVLVLDACDSMRLFVPPVPEFMAFFGAYTLDQQEKGMERDVAALIESRVRVLPAWRVVDRTRICVPSTLPGNLQKFSRSYALMLEIVDRVGEVAVEPSVKAAWRKWCEMPSRYTQVGMRILCLQRQEGA